MATSKRLLPLLQLFLLLGLIVGWVQQPADGEEENNITRADSGGFNIMALEGGGGPSSSQSTSPTPVPINLSNEFLGIPGITQTSNGYDTALGNDPICWVGFTNSSSSNNNTANTTGSAGSSSSSSSSSLTALDVVKQVFPNPLVSDFVFIETRILNECPQNNSVSIEKPLEVLAGERLRTLQEYNYTLHVQLDLDTLEYGNELITDNGDDIVALQVVVCSLGKSGFCSPFVHEQGKAFFCFPFFLLSVMVFCCKEEGWSRFSSPDVSFLRLIFGTNSIGWDCHPYACICPYVCICL